MRLGGIAAALPAVERARKTDPLSRVHCRLIEPLETDRDNEARLSFQGTVFCQAGLPYRNPGDVVRQWQRSQGAVMLVVQAGQVLRRREGAIIDVGLRWGAKPRLILAHLNAEALRQASLVIEVERSLSLREEGDMHHRINAHIARTEFARIIDLATKDNDRAIADHRSEPTVVIVSVQNLSAPPRRRPTGKSVDRRQSGAGSTRWRRPISRPKSLRSGADRIPSPPAGRSDLVGYRGQRDGPSFD